MTGITIGSMTYMDVSKNLSKIERMYFIVSLVCILLISTSHVEAWKPSKSVSKSAMKSMGSMLAALSLSGLPFYSSSALAYGPTEMEVSIKSYKAVELCNGQKPIMPGREQMPSTTRKITGKLSPS